MSRNIGIRVAAPEREADASDKKNPFNGTLAVRGKLFEGIVIKAAARDTVVVRKESPIRLAKFKRYARGTSSIHAHVPSNISVKQGDRVTAAECRPLAKSVSFVIVEVKA